MQRRSPAALATLLLAAAALALSACGPGPGKGADTAAAPAAAPEGPTHEGVGVLAAVNGQTLTIDAEAVPSAGLAAGRHDFTAYADAVADAPGEPGARVAFSFRKAGAGYELTSMKGR